MLAQKLLGRADLIDPDRGSRMYPVLQVFDQSPRFPFFLFRRHACRTLMRRGAPTTVRLNAQVKPSGGPRLGFATRLQDRILRSADLQSSAISKNHAF